MWYRSLIVCSIFVLGTSPFLASCASKQTSVGATTRSAAAALPTSRPTLASTQPVDLPGIHNVVAYTKDIYSGGVPEGKEGFETLKKLGIKSIISVDGSAPDVELAHAAGFKYVHLPVTYGGISDERKLEITRAIRDLPKPIFVHCHHGKHRSAAATALALVGLGEMTPEQGIARMKVSGTAPSYKGLYECVSLATIIDAKELAKQPDQFPEVWKTSGFVQTMVEIDDTFDALKALDKAGWKAPADHPDLVPAAEAGKLADLMCVLKDDHDVTDRPPEFAEWMHNAADQATTLEQSLTSEPINRTFASATFATVTQSCKSCHVKYRD